MKKLETILVALFAGATFAAAQQVEPFRDGDRVVFIGDSITDGGHYHSYIYLFYATRFPYMNLSVYNAGIGGDTAPMMYDRLDGDVFAKNPTYLTLMFGMNDTGYLEYKEEGADEYGEKRFNECMEAFGKIESRFKSLKDTRIAMIGCTPYDNTTETKGLFGPLPGKNEVIQRINGKQRESALENGWGYVDFNAPLVEVSLRQQEADPEFTFSRGDRVHPDNASDMMMAYFFLKAQGFEGSCVADVEIDARKLSAVKADNCEVSDIKGDKKQISFDYLAYSLPCPLDTVAHCEGKAQSKAAEMVPFVEDMNREILCVKNLPKGDWKLRIDGEEIGVWSASELSEGINLALETWTPQYRQALEVMYLNEFRWEIEQNFREYAWMQYDIFKPSGLLDVNDRHAVEVMDIQKESNGWIGWHRPNYAKYMHESVRKARWAEMEGLSRAMYEVAKPQTRKVTLVRQQP